VQALDASYTPISTGGDRISCRLEGNAKIKPAISPS